MATPKNTPLVLIIRDGWGENPNPEHDRFNAVKLARTPVDERLARDWPRTLIRTSGEDVGLPEGTMGNSEVGHQNIGAGRIVDQDSVRITKACREGKLADNPALAGAVRGAKARGGKVHLMGICSDAGVHGLLEHLYALVRLCKELGQGDVAVHLFTDGRDTGPNSGAGFVERVEEELAAIGVGRVATVVGRYWAMDRDNRWERTERAYRCLTGRWHDPPRDDAARRGSGPATTTRPEDRAGGGTGGWRVAGSAAEAVRHAYDNPPNESMKGDEFIPPTMIGRDEDDAMSTRIRDGDSVIFYNYRGDRPRQLVSAFVLPEFHGHVKPSPDSGERGFDRGRKLDIDFVMMAAYSEPLTRHAKVAFDKPPKLADILGEHLSKLGLTQIRCAETEKYAHVTFFFNDYREEPFGGEHRELIQSPKVSTYDQQPEMSAGGVCSAVLRRLEAEDCEDLIVVNFANPDMVGHTGNLDAAVRACEVVDECVGRIMDAALKRGGSLIITADHGNAEQMWDPETDGPHTAHTTYEVALYVVGGALGSRTLRSGGRLADIAPTALEMMGLDRPGAMTGRSLLE